MQVRINNQKTELQSLQQQKNQNQQSLQISQKTLSDVNNQLTDLGGKCRQLFRRKQDFESELNELQAIKTGKNILVSIFIFSSTDFNYLVPFCMCL